MAASLFGWALYSPVHNFGPYWLAIDDQGTLYATDVRGGLIWVFDSSGNPQGTLHPAKAPPVPTPGPGILPAGIEEQLNVSGLNILATPTPVGGLAYEGAFAFCGITTDPQGNLYTVNLADTTGFKLMRFDRNGMITARWPLANDYNPTNGCLAADADYVYLLAHAIAGHNGLLYVFDHNGKPVKQLKSDIEPFSISSVGNHKVTIMSTGVIGNIDIDSGALVTTTLPVPPNELHVPALSTSGGETFFADHATGKIIRISTQTGKILSSLGGLGHMAGQFQGIGGMAQDKQGRLYVADWQQRVIQRFTPDGKVDAVWWAARGNLGTGEQEGEIE